MAKLLTQGKASSDIKKMDQNNALASYVEEVKMSKLAPPTHTTLFYNYKKSSFLW